LIVDDDSHSAASPKMALEAAGHPTMSAGSAEEGLEKVRAARPGLALLDVMMPAGTEGIHFVWNRHREGRATGGPYERGLCRSRLTLPAGKPRRGRQRDGRGGGVM
jgi:hypothetical protein